MQTTKKQTPTANMVSYLGGIIEGFISLVDMIKDVKHKHLAGLIPKFRLHNIRHQPMKHISAMPQA
ncbi:MAG: hypothetical protein RR588_05415 [Solibacillus sp.]